MVVFRCSVFAEDGEQAQEVNPAGPWKILHLQVVKRLLLFSSNSITSGPKNVEQSFQKQRKVSEAFGPLKVQLGECSHWVQSQVRPSKQNQEPNQPTLNGNRLL